MKLISWNVNGIRASLKKGFFQDFVAGADADVLCLQEMRALPEQVELEIPGYEIYWNPAEKKGYSGTAMISRVEFQGIVNGMGVAEHDNEGRVITAELDDYYLVTVYTPNSGRGLVRLDYRTKRWDAAFRRYLKKLENTKPVIVCGDFNVAPWDDDIGRPKEWRSSVLANDTGEYLIQHVVQSVKRSPCIDRITQS